MKRLDQKVIGVVAEERVSDCLRQIRESDKKVDIYQIRFDCLIKGELTQDNLVALRNSPNYGSTMASARHIETVFPDRLAYEGFKYKDHLPDVAPEKADGDFDLNRVYWLREAVQHRMGYVEIEDNRRKNFILLMGKLNPKIVIRHTNLNLTPSLESLSKLFDKIAGRGADHIIIETYIREHGKDRGKKDRDKLVRLAEQKINSPIPLTIVGLGEDGAELNAEAYKMGISQFGIGVFQSLNFVPQIRKRAYHTLPTVDELNKRLGNK